MVAFLLVKAKFSLLAHKDMFWRRRCKEKSQNSFLFNRNQCGGFISRRGIIKRIVEAWEIFFAEEKKFPSSVNNKKTAAAQIMINNRRSRAYKGVILFISIEVTIKHGVLKEVFHRLIRWWSQINCWGGFPALILNEGGGKFKSLFHIWSWFSVRAIKFGLFRFRVVTIALPSHLLAYLRVWYCQAKKEKKEWNKLKII